jgi:hypothetical protein
VGLEKNIHFLTFKQGLYMWGRVKFKDFSRTFKAMYQQIQGVNTEGVRNQ